MLSCIISMISMASCGQWMQVKMTEEKKKIGRPKGSRDKFPRKLKSTKDKSVKDVKKKASYLKNLIKTVK